MIICICRAISESEIKGAIIAGTLNSFLKSRDIPSGCGLCVKLLEMRICEIKKNLPKSVKHSEE